MALNLIPNPASTPTSASQWTALVAREDVAAIGGGTAIRIFSLTNELTTARPEVAIGSKIEVGGSWYMADADTAISDDVGLIDGLVHIKLVPTGATVVPYLTSDVIPAWDSEKGGWYDGDDKFLPFEMTKTGTAYTNKCEWINQEESVKICNDGSVGLDGSLTVGGSGTFGSGLSVGGNVGVTGAITSATSLTMGGYLSSGTFGTRVGFNLASLASYTPTKGVYVVSVGDGVVCLFDGVSRPGFVPTGGSSGIFYFDGVNSSIVNNSAFTRGVELWKMV